MYMTKEIRAPTSKLGRKLQNCEMMGIDAYLDLDLNNHEAIESSTEDESD